MSQSWFGDYLLRHKLSSVLEQADTLTMAFTPAARPFNHSNITTIPPHLPLHCMHGMSLSSCQVLHQRTSTPAPHHCNHTCIATGVVARAGEHTSEWKPRAPGTHPAAYNDNPGFAVFKHLNKADNLEAALNAVTQTSTKKASDKKCTLPATDESSASPVPGQGSNGSTTTRSDVRTAKAKKEPRSTQPRSASIPAAECCCAQCNHNSMPANTSLISMPLGRDAAETTAQTAAHDGVQEPEAVQGTEAPSPCQTRRLGVRTRARGKLAAVVFGSTPADILAEALRPEPDCGTNGVRPQTSAQVSAPELPHSEAEMHEVNCAHRQGVATTCQGSGMVLDRRSNSPAGGAGQTHSHRGDQVEISSGSAQTCVDAAVCSAVGVQGREAVSTHIASSATGSTPTAKIRRTHVDAEEGTNVATPTPPHLLEPVYHGARIHPSLIGSRGQVAVSSTTALQRLAEAVTAAECLDVKEVLESVEFVERVRKRVRKPVMLDLAAGHGLVGMLLAAVEPSVEHVVMVDWKCPKAFNTVCNALGRIAPWALPKLTYFQYNLCLLDQYLLELPSHVTPYLANGRSPSPPPYQPMLNTTPTPNTARSQHAAASGTVGAETLGRPVRTLDTPLHEARTLDEVARSVQGHAMHGDVGVVAVHACGQLTDVCLSMAMLLKAPVAVMPCCYTGMAAGAPQGVKRMLGVSLAANVHRHYTLASAGCYTTVDFASIPSTVTPANRIIVAQVGKSKKK